MENQPLYFREAFRKVYIKHSLRERDRKYNSVRVYIAESLGRWWNPNTLTFPPRKGEKRNMSPPYFGHICDCDWVYKITVGKKYDMAIYIYQTLRKFNHYCKDTLRHHPRIVNCRVGVGNVARNGGSLMINHSMFRAQKLLLEWVHEQLSVSHCLPLVYMRI